MSLLGTSFGAGDGFVLGPFESPPSLLQLGPFKRWPLSRQQLWQKAKRYKLGAVAILCLLTGLAATAIVSTISSYQIKKAELAAAHLPIVKPPTKGPNRMVSQGDLAQTLASITNQLIGISVGPNQVSFDQATIGSWLDQQTDKSRGVTYLHVNQAKITSSINNAIAKFNVSPTNQVSVNHGSGDQVIVAGRNGASVGSPTSDITQIASALLDGKGLNLSLPLNSVSFSALTPASFNKLIEVDVNAKQMWLYQNGQVVNQYAVDAGGPQTPTPIGQFHILYKLPVQTMTGFNPDGTRYVQPNVKWVNYFYSGDAIHGNYWVPAWHFGVVNSSHGCVSVPNDEAEWIYNWAPVGTTVITHV